jgi:hypothetical protein
MADGKPKSNGSPRWIAKAGATQIRTRRTLLWAALFAAAGMAFVPCVFFEWSGNHRVEVQRSYVPFFAMQPNSAINAMQLLVNVAFSALIGIVAANMSRRQLLLMAAGIAIFAGGAGFIVATRPAVRRAQSDYNLALSLMRQREYGAAKQYFHNSAMNWRLALDVVNARRVEAEERKCPSPIPDAPLPARELAQVDGTAQYLDSGFLQCTIYNSSFWSIKSIHVHFEVIDVIGSSTSPRPPSFSRDIVMGGTDYLAPLATRTFSQFIGFRRNMYQKWAWRLDRAEGQPPR